MKGAHRSTGHNDRYVDDERCYTLSRRSLDHCNYKICPKDHPVTALFFRGSDGRSIILTVASLELGVHWKVLSPPFLPVQGSERRSLMGSEDHVNAVGLEPVSPPVISLQVDMQKEWMIGMAGSIGPTKSCIVSSSSGEVVVKQSCNRNKWTKSCNNSSSIDLLNCSVPNDSSSGIISNASTAVVPHDQVNDILKMDKPVKRSSRKKAKKKGKQCTRSIHKKCSMEPEADCEESTCKISVCETSVDNDPSCSGKSISESNSTEKPTSRGLSVQATTERNDNKENSGEINPSTSSMTCASYGDEMDYSKPRPLVFEDFAVENVRPSYSQLGTEESSSHLTDTPRQAETLEILSTFSEDVTSSPMRQSNNSGKTTLNDFSGHISSNCRQTDMSDPDSIVERRYCGSQASSTETFHPVILSKKGRHSRNVSGSSHGIPRFGRSNIHDQTGKDTNHSVWQKVRKNESELFNCDPQNVNPVSSLLGVASQGSVVRAKGDAFELFGENEDVKSYTYPCIDEMSAQRGTFGLVSNSMHVNKFLSKSNVGKRENNVPGKLRRKSGPVPKQELNHCSTNGFHSGKNNVRVTKVFVPQKKAVGILSTVNHHKVYTAGSKSPCSHNVQKTPSDSTDCHPSDSQKHTDIDGAMPFTTICSMGCDTTDQANQNPISLSSRTSDSVDKASLQFSLSDSRSSEFCKEPHLSLYHLADNEITGCTGLETEASFAEQSKQNQNFGPVVQKWAPIGKTDATLSNTSQIDSSSTSTLHDFVSNGWITKSLEVEQLNSIDHQFHPLTGSGVALSRPVSQNVDCLASGDDGRLINLNCLPIYTSKEQNQSHAASNLQSAQETKYNDISRSETDLSNITQAVTDAYRLQIASEGLELVTGSPVAEFERLIHSAAPLLGQMHNFQTCNSCSWDRLIGDSMCQHQIPNISLRGIWQWYENSGTYGLEVKVEDHNSRRLGNDRVAFCAYFVPYLSAIQLFGKSRSSMCTSTDNSNGEVEKPCEVDKKSSKLNAFPMFPLLSAQPCKQVDTLDSPSSLKDEVFSKSAGSPSLNEGNLLFEYFESDQPHRRRPLFEKIKELVRSNAHSNGQMFGDPCQLEYLDLPDLHPASWYSVAWYPIYRIPDGNLRAAFLTYHSLGHFIHRNASSNFSGGVSHIVSPVVGLEAYNGKGECWFEDNSSKSKTAQAEEGSSLNPSETLKERLRTLEQTAATMARASVRKGDKKSLNRQPDYEFFLSRRR